MPSGRIPNDKTLAVAKGQFRKDRHEGQMTETAVGLDFFKVPPEPETKMTKATRDRWDDLCDKIIAVRGYVSTLDLPLLEEYCHLLSDLDELRRKPKIIKGGNLTRISPERKLYNEILKEVKSIAQLFGFTPSARSNMKLQQPSQEANPVAGYGTL